MAYIKFGNKYFFYQSEDIDADVLSPISKEEAKTVLLAAQDIFKDAGLDIYLAFGTLLGAVRENDFIKNDYDIDVYVKDEYKLFLNLYKVKHHGLLLIRVIKHKIYTFKYKNSNCFIDVYILSRKFNPWGVYCYRLCNAYIPKKLLSDGSVHFLGRKFMSVQNPERLLEFWYTESWRTPMSLKESVEKQIKYIYDVPSHYYFKSKIVDPLREVTKMFCKSVLGGKYYKKLKGFVFGYEV